MRRELCRLAIILGFVGLGAPETGHAAQAASQAKIDSLSAEIRTLRAQLDSLRRMLAELRTESERRRAREEIERLKEAARRATAARDTSAGAHEQEPVFTGRERAQQALNPEISITGDVVGFAGTRLGESDTDVTALPREFEFSFQTAIDPFARMKVFVTREEEIPLDPADPEAEEEGGFEIEEAYAYWVGLPGGLGLDAGKIRQQLGILNRWHTHALPEADFPLALRHLLGPEGLVQTGASLYWLTPFSGDAGTYELWLQVTAASNDLLFPESNAPTALVHLNNYWDLSDATYFQLGLTGLYAEDDDADGLRTRLAGADLAFNWRPPARALYREFTFRSEILWMDRRTSAEDLSAWGGYAAGYYKLGQRWLVGLRFDFLDRAEPGAPDQWQIVPSITRWWTEFLRLRAQWVTLNADGDSHNQFLLQLVWAVGPHREEIY